MGCNDGVLGCLQECASQAWEAVQSKVWALQERICREPAREATAKELNNYIEGANAADEFEADNLAEKAEAIAYRDTFEGLQKLSGRFAKDPNPLCRSAKTSEIPLQATAKLNDLRSHWLQKNRTPHTIMEDATVAVLEMGTYPQQRSNRDAGKLGNRFVGGSIVFGGLGAYMGGGLAADGAIATTVAGGAAFGATAGITLFVLLPTAISTGIFSAIESGRRLEPVKPEALR